MRAAPSVPAVPEPQERQPSPGASPYPILQSSAGEAPSVLLAGLRNNDSCRSQLHSRPPKGPGAKRAIKPRMAVESDARSQICGQTGGLLLSGILITLPSCCWLQQGEKMLVPWVQREISDSSKQGASSPSHPPAHLSPSPSLQPARVLAAISRVTSIKAEAQHRPSGEKKRPDVRETTCHG
ncbi:uncharacterized protein LOC124979661 isoform X2 [Sciurus carolinensis]|uniref:uncharacterized protein LOC124979661 isoform X2 n=1 Tax=Sciurus carolinensis TaxID=30640 RepID=UPI001FB3DC40|nr:uncharacterized protein LOC124979661 isoform X2 [Sciurus carolinensis]